MVVRRRLFVCRIVSGVQTSFYTEVVPDHRGVSCTAVDRVRGALNSCKVCSGVQCAPDRLSVTQDHASKVEKQVRSYLDKS